MPNFVTPGKPLGTKAYGSIPHLPGSRRGPGDHGLSDQQAAICLEKPRKGDVIHVQEKLDGSCCSVFYQRETNTLLSLVRAGYPAETSPFRMHHLFAEWVYENTARFMKLLKPGERAIGEWLIQAHGTRYKLPHEPFVLFDIITGPAKRGAVPRLVLSELMRRNELLNNAEPGQSSKHMTQFVMPRLIWSTMSLWPEEGSMSIDEAMKRIDDPRYAGFHGAIDPIEGAVWRVEANGVVDFLAKYVRPDKKDGSYLPVETKAAEVWNENPWRALA
jgi:hypothetical protein